MPSPSLTVGACLQVSGCVTKEKFIRGRTLADIERYLGFSAGRLREGMAVAALRRLPELNQFQLAGYSNVATHRHVPPPGLDIERLKANALATWSVMGPERLVKVLPAIRHNPSLEPDVQYPPGDGVPQWIVTAQIDAIIVAVVNGYPDSRLLMR